MAHNLTNTELEELIQHNSQFKHSYLVNNPKHNVISVDSNFKAMQNASERLQLDEAYSFGKENYNFSKDVNDRILLKKYKRKGSKLNDQATQRQILDAILSNKKEPRFNLTLKMQ